MPGLLSIIVPVLAEKRQLVASLQALQSLRANGAELIVVDGGSSDHSVARWPALWLMPC